MSEIGQIGSGQNGATVGGWQRLRQQGAAVADAFTRAETRYNSAIQSGDQKRIYQAEVAYKKATTNFAALRQMLQNSFQIMMEAIRNMSVR